MKEMEATNGMTRKGRKTMKPSKELAHYADGL